VRKLIFILLWIILLLGCSTYWFKGEPVRAEEVTAVSTTTETVKTTSATLDLSTLVAKLPSLKNSVLYSYNGNQVKYAMSFSVMGFFKMKDGENFLSIDAMYVPADEVGTMATIKLVNLGKIVNFPILEYINLRPAVFVGAKNIGSGNDIEFDYGVGLSILDIKF